jgi:hypothetical protein
MRGQEDEAVSLQGEGRGLSKRGTGRYKEIGPRCLGEGQGREGWPMQGGRPRVRV